MQSGDLHAAVHQLRHAVLDDPKDPTAFGYLGIAYGELDLPEQAAEALKQAVLLAPEDAGLHYNLAIALERAGRKSEAVEAYRECLRLDPEHERARQSLSELHEEPVPPPRPAFTHAAVPAAAVEPASQAAVPAATRPVAADPTALREPGAVDRPAAGPLSGWTGMGTGRPLTAALLLGMGGVVVLVAVMGMMLGGQFRQGRRNGPSILPALGWQAPRGVNDLLPVSELTQAPSGPGVQVCEPVPLGSGDVPVAFGAGCARWLQFALAGEGGLGRTPLWSSGDYTCRELGRTHLRAMVAEADRVAFSLGVTYVAVGQVRGDSSDCTLTYRLLEAPHGRPVGEPMVFSGTQEAILAKLPIAAREICKRLGVEAERIPGKPGEGAADLRALGALPWYPGEALTDADVQELNGIRGRSPLAGLLYVINRGDAQDLPAMQDAASRLLEQASDHPLVLAQLGRSATAAGAGPVLGLYKSPLDTGLGKYPNNQLYQIAALYHRQGDRDFNASRRSAEMAVRCSVRNPNAWLSLAGLCYMWADSLRGGKHVQDLSGSQGDAVKLLATHSVEAAERATALDPHHLDGWLNLSNCAALAGDAEMADSALWHALEQYPNEPAIYSWGLQLYGERWLNDRNRAEVVARRALAAAAGAGGTWSPARRVEVAAFTHLAGFPDLARKIVRTETERAGLLKWVAAQKSSSTELENR